MRLIVFYIGSSCTEWEKWMTGVGYTSGFGTCSVVVKGPIATIEIIPPAELKGGTSDLHYDLARVFANLRHQDQVRVIILTGSPASERDEFYVPMPADFYETDLARSYLTDASGAWRTFSGVIQVHEAMSQIEKPIVAKVNGSAVGFGSSLVFACDLIIAAEDAVIVDMHLGVGEVPEGGPRFGIVPGDGGAVVIPESMPRALANEALLLARRFTGSELARLGIINRAVSRDHLDEAVDEVVAALLRRPSYGLAWSKRLINKKMRLAVQEGIDYGAAYEMVTFLQLERTGWVDPSELGSKHSLESKGGNDA